VTVLVNGVLLDGARASVTLLSTFFIPSTITEKLEINLNGSVSSVIPEWNIRLKNLGNAITEKGLKVDYRRVKYEVISGRSDAIQALSSLSGITSSDLDDLDSQLTNRAISAGVCSSATFCIKVLDYLDVSAGEVKTDADGQTALSDEGFRIAYVNAPNFGSHFNNGDASLLNWVKNAGTTDYLSILENQYGMPSKGSLDLKVQVKVTIDDTQHFYTVVTIN
ncbi:hypothetical protein KJJ67_004396, partial [Salmonella enterica]|nr:hypothetical protein [Salmonella enterica]